MIKGVLATAAALSLVASPVGAAAAQAAPTEVAPASENASGMSLVGGTWWPFLIGAVVVGLVIWAVSDNNDHHHRPVSP